MDERFKIMLERYNCQSRDDYINALKEIMQEIALLGLWRSKFFEHAAFYGGTSLRILYRLDRFSEDLYFSLLTPNSRFQLEKYNKAIKLELNSFGIGVVVVNKTKTQESNIKSAFIKAGTKKQLITLNIPTTMHNKLHEMEKLKIKMEVDINPPGDFQTEAKALLQPIPFNVNTYKQPDLFARKLHAILCRKWKNRVKGRDWYDLVWFIGNNIPVRLKHLRARLIDSKALSTTDILTHQKLLKMLEDKINQVNFNDAKREVLPFVNNPDKLSIWSTAFFQEIIERITAV